MMGFVRIFWKEQHPRGLLTCEQALLFGQAKWASREHASEGTRKGEQEIKWMNAFISSPWGRNECVTNEPQRTSAGRLGKVQMKFYKRSLQALLSSAPRGLAARSRVLARLASLPQIGELARRLEDYLPKTSISGQIAPEVLAQLCFDGSIQILLNLTWV